jgi:hypothetical protein
VLALVATGVAALTASACASAGGTATPPPGAPAGGAAGTGATPTPAQPWTVGTREHVDLWLHGYAMLLDDTATVPLFRRGYREAIRARRAGVTTRLDAERDRLRARLGANPRLALEAQFVVFPFDSWEELRGGLAALAQSGGDPRQARDQQGAAILAFLAQAFPTAPDREWARVFGEALEDERARFFHQHWLAEQRARSSVLSAAESQWRATVPRLQPLLNGTRQREGTILLSLPLGGEGRTSATSGRSALVTVGFPAANGDPAEATYVAVHELVGTLVGQAVTDNVTPSERRAGVEGRYVSAGQVRGGLMALQRLAPALAPGYARFYLREAGRPAGSDPVAALVAAFPLPQAIADAIRTAVEGAQGGI